MRRKKRFGIYTGQTVKRCRIQGCCRDKLYCNTCKGVCRKVHNDYNEYALQYEYDEVGGNTRYHTIDNTFCCFSNKNRTHKIHQHGVGSLDSRNKFITYDSWWHKHLTKFKRVSKNTYFKGDPDCIDKDFYNDLQMKKYTQIHAKTNIQQDLKHMIEIEELMNAFKEYKRVIKL